MGIQTYNNIFLFMGILKHVYGGPGCQGYKKNTQAIIRNILYSIQKTTQKQLLSFMRDHEEPSATGDYSDKLETGPVQAPFGIPSFKTSSSCGLPGSFQDQVFPVTNFSYKILLCKVSLLEIVCRHSTREQLFTKKSIS